MALSIARTAAGSSATVDARSSHLFVGSVEKGFRILRSFGANQRTMGLTDLATASGLDKSAAQRFAYTLVALGYLRKDKSTKRYSLSPRVLEFGVDYLQADARVECALPHLLALAKECNETINFTELDDVDVVYVARIPSPDVVRINLPLGTRAPAFCTATGRAMLANLPRPEAVAVIDRSRLVRYTSTTVIDRDELLRILDKTYRQGFSITAGEHFPGTIAVAAPVFEYADRVVAAASISLPAQGCTVKRAGSVIAPVIVNAARTISAALARRVGASR